MKTTTQREVWILQNATTDHILGVYSSENAARRVMKPLAILKQVVDSTESNTDFSREGGVIFMFVNEGFRITKSWLKEEVDDL